MKVSSASDDLLIFTFGKSLSFLGPPIIQLERQNQPLFSSLREYNLAYGITQERLSKLTKEIIIMHPGPINRGVEMDSDVADSQHSIILDQVENGVAVRMACLYLLTGRTNPTS